MAESVIVLAGAGVAASAGLPALHSTASLLHNPFYSKVLSPQEYGNYLPAFWAFAREKAEEAWALPPSSVHRLVQERGWRVITQNIGGHHRRAGSQEVVEVYGTLFSLSCLRCQAEEPFPIEAYRRLGKEEVPTCSSCGKARTRPNISLPGESLKHKKQAQSYLASATHALYLGVEEGSGPTATWYQRVPESILVAEDPSWGSFSKRVPLSPKEWARQGGKL